MARKPRQESKSGIYHVVNRGIEKKAIFAQSRERTRMENLIRENYKKYQVKIYAYCIMPNHFHILLKAELGALASFMAVISAKYAFYYNYKHNRSGMVFQNRFRSQCVEDEKYFWNCLRYIHMNPVKANLSKILTEYKYCSIKEYYSLVKKEEKILADDSRMLVESKYATMEEFAEFHRHNCRDLFIDTADEEMDQKVKIAEDILEEYARKQNVTVFEVLDYVKLRREFENELKVCFNISHPKAIELRKVIKDNLMQK